MKCIRWTNRYFEDILKSLVFSASFCLCCSAEESFELQEAKVARQSAEKRVMELELELEKLRTDHQKLRSRYATLYLDSHKTIQQLRDLELRASGLLQDKSGSDREQLPGEAMEALSLSVSRQLKLLDALADFEKYISNLMDVLQPSNAVKAELGDKVTALKSTVEQSLRPLSIVARRGSDGPDAGTCGVVSIRQDDSLVILDKGSLTGVKPGQKWILKAQDGSVAARLLTVGCRPELSAAILLEGSFTKIGVGSILLPER